MDDRLAENLAAGRELARRLPWWTVWYGEYTGRFWAVPRGGGLSAAPHIEAVTAEELEGTARHIERVLTEWKETPQPDSPANEARLPGFPTGRAPLSDSPAARARPSDSLARKGRTSRDGPHDPPGAGGSGRPPRASR